MEKLKLVSLKELREYEKWYDDLDHEDEDLFVYDDGCIELVGQGRLSLNYIIDVDEEFLSFVNALPGKWV